MDADQDSELAELFARAQDGDNVAYAKFLFQVTVVLRGFLLKRMTGNDMSEDVLQETLLTIHRARHTYVPGKNVWPWLYTICEHRMIDFYRKYRRLEKREVTIPDAIMNFAATSEVAAESERADQIRQAMTNLPEKQRQVIEWLKLNDLSTKEVAAKTGMTEGAVKITAHRGYETLRQWFGVKKRENR